MSISVCIATYNGEKYILEQLNSILSEIKLDDEIIVVDDCSKDSTVQILNSIDDSRIKIFLNERNRGHVFSFSRTVSLAKNEFIFLSDQDDIWLKGRVNLMMKGMLDSKYLLASSNFKLFKLNSKISKLNKNPLREDDSTKHFDNIIGIFLGKRSYYGCVMAFRKQLVDIILPIPSYVKSHDLWIAMAGNLLNSNLHIDKNTLLRRIHNNNVTDPNRKLLPKLWTRVIFLIMIISLSIRIRKRAL